MKTLIIFAVTILGALNTFAQKALLVLDEQNKYAYHQVKEAPGFTADSLQTGVARFLAKNYPKISLSNAAASLSGRGTMLVFKKGHVVSQEEGAVNYILKLDFKAGKYRLLISNFTYMPYRRTRYGTFEPETGLVIPLENHNKFKTEQLNNYLDRVGSFSAHLDKQLNANLSNTQHGKPAHINADLKQVKTREW